MLSPRPEALIGTKVSLLIDPVQKIWKTEVMENMLLSFEEQSISTIPLCRTNQPDILTWPYNPKGEYTIKSRYQFLQREFQNAQPGQSDVANLKPLCQAIWNIPLPNKVKNLVWRATKNSLPSKANLVHRKIIQHDCCDLCREHKKDVKHALYSYPKLEDFCKKMPQWSHDNLKRVVTFIDLLGTIFAENREPAFFAMVVWALWNRRNNLRLGKKAKPLTHLMQQAKQRLGDFQRHNTAWVEPVGRPPISWQPPGPFQYKVNVDRALFEADNTAGLGVLIRNEHGQVMACLSEHILLPPTVVEVEALAAKRGLDLAMEMGFRNIVLKSDSLILITALWEGSCSLSSFGHIVQDIKFIASYLSSINYTHVRKQCNALAHSLARRAKLVPQCQIWMENVPPDSSSVLQADLFGLL